MGIITDLINQGLLDNESKEIDKIMLSQSNISDLRSGKTLTLSVNSSKYLICLKPNSFKKPTLSHNDYLTRRILSRSDSL